MATDRDLQVHEWNGRLSATVAMLLAEDVTEGERNLARGWLDEYTAWRNELRAEVQASIDALTHRAQHDTAHGAPRPRVVNKNRDLDAWLEQQDAIHEQRLAQGGY